MDSSGAEFEVVLSSAWVIPDTTLLTLGASLSKSDPSSDELRLCLDPLDCVELQWLVVLIRLVWLAVLEGGPLRVELCDRTPLRLPVLLALFPELLLLFP